MNGNAGFGLIKPNDRSLAQQASQWLEILKRDEPVAREAFVAWLKESPRHVREYLLMVALDRELSGIDPGKQQDLQALLAEVDANVVPWGTSATVTEQISVRAPRRLGHWAGAVAAALALIVLAWWLPDRGWQNYSTAIGEQRTVELDDGSTVEMNARTRLKVSLSDTARDLRLLEGEAVFKVRKELSRPFTVHTDTAVIRALGTQFNVHVGKSDTRVSVLEGAVRVYDSSSSISAKLDAGEEVNVDAARPIVKTKRPDVAKSVAWRQRRLVFNGDRLADIASEFNRYNRRPQLRLAQPEVGERRYTGTFDANDPQALALLLSQEHELQVTTEQDEIVIAPRAR